MGSGGTSPSRVWLRLRRAVFSSLPPAAFFAIFDLSSRMATIAVLGTLDTKGIEHEYVAAEIRRRGHRALLIDVGALEAPAVPPDITRDEVARAAGLDLAALAARRDRGETVAA